MLTAGFLELYSDKTISKGNVRPRKHIQPQLNYPFLDTLDINSCWRHELCLKCVHNHLLEIQKRPIWFRPISAHTVGVLPQWHTSKSTARMCLCERTLLLLNALRCLCDSQETPTALIASAKKKCKREEGEWKETAHQAVSVSVWLCPQTWGKEIQQIPSLSFPVKTQDSFIFPFVSNLH